MTNEPLITEEKEYTTIGGCLFTLTTYGNRSISDNSGIKSGLTYQRRLRQTFLFLVSFGSVVCVFFKAYPALGHLVKVIFYVPVPVLPGIGASVSISAFGSSLVTGFFLHGQSRAAKEDKLP